MATPAPASASAWATAKPIPRVPPVTTALRPCRKVSCMTPCYAEVKKVHSVRPDLSVHNIRRGIMEFSKGVFHAEFRPGPDGGGADVARRTRVRHLFPAAQREHHFLGHADRRQRCQPRHCTNLISGGRGP